MSHSLAPHPALRVVDGIPTTSSLDVAEHFGKQHKNVLRDIQALDCPAEFSRLNFEPRDFIDSRGKVQPMVSMTRDGFTILAMGFTGHKAMAWKCAYIQAFNRYEVSHQVVAELFRASPVLAQVQRYWAMGLTLVEIGRLVKKSDRSVSRYVGRLNACGLLGRDDAGQRHLGSPA